VATTTAGKGVVDRFYFSGVCDAGRQSCLRNFQSSVPRVQMNQDASLSACCRLKKKVSHNFRVRNLFDSMKTALL
jgi:hypothetical protein